MKQLRWYHIAVAMAALLVTVTCGGDKIVDPPDEPVTLVLSLTTPNSDDGAVMFSISGGGITKPTTENSSHVLFYRAAGATSSNAVVAGDITAGALVRFEVPDVDVASSYSATVTEVAARDNTLRGSLAGYSLSISLAGGS